MTGGPRPPPGKVAQSGQADAYQVGDQGGAGHHHDHDVALAERQGDQHRDQGAEHPNQLERGLEPAEHPALGHGGDLLLHQ